MFAHEEADATAEGEPGDASVAHDAAGGGKTVGLRLVIDVAPQRTTLHPGPAADGVDPHRPHGREVDDDPLVAHRGAGHIMAPAPYGDVQVVVAGEPHGRGHIGGAAASGDQPAPGPFALASPAQNRDLLARIDFRDVEIEEIRAVWSFASFDDYWDLQSTVSGPLAVLIGSLAVPEIAAIQATLEPLLEPFRSGAGYEIPSVAVAVSAT